MKNIFENLGGDGAHHGLTDWYTDIQDKIIEALQGKHGEEWTTEWYSSKKAFATCKLTCEEENLTIEVSVSDDFDTYALGVREIPCEVLKTVKDNDLKKIHKAIDEAWDEAKGEQNDKREIAMYCIGNRDGDKRTNWIETYLLNVSVFGEHEAEPPGDQYHQWGFQEETEDIPDDVKKIIEDKMKVQQPKIRCKGWIAEVVKD